MSGYSLAQQATDAFNQHGSFTARLVENDLAIEIRAVDGGELLTTLWQPTADDEGWAWIPPGSYAYRNVDSGFRVEQVVRIVATSLLDERPKR